MPDGVTSKEDRSGDLGAIGQIVDNAEKGSNLVVQEMPNT